MTSSNKKDLIVTLADANFIDQAKQLFSSVYFNAAWSGDYLLLACGINDKDLAWFESKGILVYKQPLLANSPLGIRSYPPIVLSKFYLFQEYFKKWNKIIFLDADIIVRAPLDKLLRLKGFNAPKAVTFRLKDEFISDKTKIKAITRNYSLRGPAFNTGVLVFDSSLIEVDTFDKIISLYNNIKDLCQYQEESTLNLLFYKKWHVLPIVYNSTPWYMRKTYCLKDSEILAYIIHFVCEEFKPWHERSYYYKEWSANLAKAEQINLTMRSVAINNFSGLKLFSYTFYLKMIDFFHLIYSPLIMIDGAMGRLGLIIKKKNPELYKVINIKKFLKFRLKEKDE